MGVGKGGTNSMSKAFLEDLVSELMAAGVYPKR